MGARLKELQDELADLKIERDSLGNELADAHKETDDLRRRLQSSYVGQVQSEFFAELRQQLDKLTEENAIFACQNRSLRAEISGTNSENAELRRAVESLSNTKAENQQLQSVIARLTAELDAWKLLGPNPDSTKADLAARLTAYESLGIRESARKMEAQLEEVRGELAAAVAATGRMREIEKANEDFHRTIQSQATENSKLSLQLHEIELLIQNQKQATDEYVEIKSQNEKMAAQVRVFHEKMRELLRQNGDLIGRLQIYQHRDQLASQFEIENLGLRQQIENMEAAMATKDRYLAELKEVLSESEERAMSFVAKFKVLADENQQLRGSDAPTNADDRLVKLQTEIEQKNLQLSELIKENEELNELCELSVDQIGLVQKALTEIQKALAVISKEKEQLEQEAEEFKQMLQSMEAENQELKQQIEVLDVPFSDDNDELREENRSLQRQLRALKSEMAAVISYRSRCDTLSNQVDRLIVENKALKSRFPDEAIEIQIRDDDQRNDTTGGDDDVAVDADFVDVVESEDSQAEGRQSAEVLSKLLNEELGNSERLAMELGERQREIERLGGLVEELNGKVAELGRENQEQGKRIGELEAARRADAVHIAELNQLLNQ